jgi:hypothetical protein
MVSFETLREMSRHPISVARHLRQPSSSATKLACWQRPTIVPVQEGSGVPQYPGNSFRLDCLEEAAIARDREVESRSVGGMLCWQIYDIYSGSVVRHIRCVGSCSRCCL